MSVSVPVPASALALVRVSVVLDSPIGIVIASVSVRVCVNVFAAPLRTRRSSDRDDDERTLRATRTATRTWRGGRTRPKSNSDLSPESNRGPREIARRQEMLGADRQQQSTALRRMSSRRDGDEWVEEEVAIDGDGIVGVSL